MAVRDIKQIEPAKRLEIRGHGGHLPAGVLHSIGRDEVEERGGCHIGLHPRGERAAGELPVAKAEKHRLGVARGDEQVPGAVVLLVGPRLLVLANVFRAVLFRLDAAHDPQLGLTVPNLPVEIEAGLGIAEQRACGDHRLQVSVGLFVDRGRVAVGLRRQIDLGANHVQKRSRLAGRPLAGLLSRDHVVGIAGDLGGVGGGRAESGEGMDADHGWAGSCEMGAGRYRSLRCPCKRAATGTGRYRTAQVANLCYGRRVTSQS